MISVTKVYRPREARKRKIELIWMNEKPLLRFCPSLRIWRSFAVLRRISLATLAQRLRQAQNDNWDVVGTRCFTTSHAGN